MSSLDDIKRKIDALMKKARGTDNESEAFLFMEKAKEMLDRHQLTEDDLQDVNDELNQSKAVSSWKKSNPWRHVLFSAVARLYNCEPYYTSYTNGYVEGNIIGRKSARIMFENMYPFIEAQVKKQARTISTYQFDPMRARKQVGDGLAYRIFMLLKKREAENRKEDLRAHVSNRSKKGTIILVEENDAWMQENLGNMVKTEPEFDTSAEAFIAAKRISLETQIGREDRPNPEGYI